MDWIRRLWSGDGGGETELSRLTDRSLRREIELAQRNTLHTFAKAMDSVDERLGLVEHSARVASLAGWLGERCGISEADDYILRTAAHLHEIGMVAVPSELLERRAPLSEGELESVRMQAEISARVARPVHHPRIVELIRRQYQDHGVLRQEELLSPRDLMLAGIFRVADVMVAVTWPRPYQDPLSWEWVRNFFGSESGTRFHPEAVAMVLRS